jgi:hypothetical protein
MQQLQACHHERARFYSIQQLGNLPPVELWHCPTCKSTISVEGVRQASKRPAAA